MTDKSVQSDFRKDGPKSCFIANVVQQSYLEHRETASVVTSIAPVTGEKVWEGVLSKLGYKIYKYYKRSEYTPFQSVLCLHM